MKLSEQLQQINDSGDVGDSINGLAEKAKMLEDALQYIVKHYNWSDVL